MATTPAPGTSSQSTLSDWAGGYVTDMLGKAQAISEQPYQVYQGPMTAGESGLQNKVFQGLGNLSFPSQLGQTFSSTGAYTPPAMTPGAYTPGAIGTGAGAPQDMGIGSLGGMAASGTTGGTTPPPLGMASQYMNPYLQSVLQPQLEELRRQSQINLQPGLAKMTQAGGYGGGRQAIMESEANRNLLQEQNKTIGQGYASAYDKAMGQFNTEQGQAKTLADIMGQAGGQQRGIEQEGITADYNEFLAQRDYPMKQTQYLQSMLQGLPISTVSTSPASQTGLGALQSTVGTLGSTYDLLKKLKVIE
tara:strand:- start:544 stop:1458 length:915 start_codon:yes stop_codon:yes gene_type:complete